MRVEQQVRAGERQAEGEPEERGRDEVRRVVAERAALIDEPHDRRREHCGERGSRDQQEVDLAHAVRHRVAQVRQVAVRREARERREQDGRERDAEHPLRQHVDAERGIDRARRLVGHERAERRVDQQVEVDHAEPDRHRQHQAEDAQDARVAPVDRPLEVEADAPEHRQRHQQLHERAGQHAERVRVELVLPVEERLDGDQHDDDHHVPHQRRDRRDREVLERVEDPDDKPVDAEQHDDREQHLAEADGQVVELRRERVTGEERHDQPRAEDEQRGDRAERGEHHEQQRRGEARGLALATVLQQLGEDRHERSRERRVGEQAADEVRDLEGDREGRERTGGAEVARRDHLAHEPGDAGQSGGDREDRGVACEPPAAGRRIQGILGRRLDCHERAIVRRAAALTAAPFCHGQHSLPEEAHPARRA